MLEIYWQIYPESMDQKLYLFIDEPQVIDNWEAVVRSIQDEYDYPIYITGSSSKLLSTDIAASLRGRSIRQTIYPLSFKEFLEFKNMAVNIDRLTAKDKSAVSILFSEYLQYGGYPEVVLENNISEKLKILKEYLDMTVYKDIVERYHIKNTNLMMRTINQLITQATKEVSVHKIFLDMKSLGLKVSKNTIYSNYKMLEDALFIHSFRKIDRSIRKEENSLPKTYLNDTGFMTLYNPNDHGKKLENHIAIALKRKADDNPLLKSNYYRPVTGASECDFVLREGNVVKEAIQVCYYLNDENKERERKGLLEALGKFNLNAGLIITFDREDSFSVDEKKITVTPGWKWLLQ